MEISFKYPQLRIANHIREAKQTQESSDFGYGLGLELMRQLCAKLGWHIDVAIEQQRFTVTLEFAALPAAPKPPLETTWSNASQGQAYPFQGKFDLHSTPHFT